MQESVASHAVDKQGACVVRLLLPLGRVDCSDRRSRFRLKQGRGERNRTALGEIRIGCGKAAEVAFTEEFFSRTLQQREIDPPRERIDVARKEWRAELVHAGLDEEDAILVRLRYGGVSRVKTVRDDARFENPDGGGQGAVERAEQVPFRDSRLQCKAGDLRQGMYAGVRAAGSLGQRGLSDRAAEGGL